MLKVGNMCLGKPKIYIQHITTVIDLQVGILSFRAWSAPKLT